MKEKYSPSHHVDQWFNEEGQLHREDGPAQVWESGIQEWFKDGKLHRMDGPAVVYPPGWTNTDKWYYEGKFIFYGRKPQVDPKRYYQRKMRAYLNKVALLQMEEVQSE